MATRIEKTDLARDALYDKVNTMIDEVNTKIDNKDSIPSQTGNAGKFLTTDGTNASWGEVKQIEIKQDLTNPSADTVPSTKAVSDESSHITTLMNTKQDKSTAVNYTNVTNCITEIPQDIKLELNNGTLTLKAGSKVYVPNGAGVFDTLNIARDITLTQGWGTVEKCALCIYGGNDLAIMSANRCVSGSSDSISGTDHWYYDTTNNTIRFVSGDGTTRQTQMSLTIAIITMTGNNANVASIDQVFNGFGYIGSTVFALPGVKGLIPNGRNADGSLKNIEFTVDKVISKTYPTNVGTAWLALNATDLGVVNFTYNEESNYVYNNNNIVPYINKAAYLIVDSSGKITSLTPKTVFHALDYNESRRLESDINNKVSKSGDTMTGNLIINGNIPAYILQDSTLDLSKTFTDNRNDLFFLERDKNGKDGSFITFRHDKYDANVAEIVASNGIDPNRKMQGMGIWVKKNGEYGTYAPKCSFNNSILTTLSSGSNYVRFGNGLQICWGKCSPAEQTVTLPQPFKDTNYVVNMTLGPDEIDRRNDFCAVIFNIITTSFRKGDRGQLWIAIGYWY